MTGQVNGLYISRCLGEGSDREQCTSTTRMIGILACDHPQLAWTDPNSNLYFHAQLMVLVTLYPNHVQFQIVQLFGIRTYNPLLATDSELKHSTRSRRLVVPTALCINCASDGDEFETNLKLYTWLPGERINLRHNKCTANWVQCNKKAGSSEGKDWMKTKNDIMKIKKHLL